MNFKEFSNKLLETKKVDALLESVNENNADDALNKYLSAALYVGMIKKLNEAPRNVIKTAISKISDVVDYLEDFKVSVDGKVYTINWDGETVTVKNENGEEVFSLEVDDVLRLKDQLIDFFTGMEDEEEQPMPGEEEVSKEDELILDTMIDNEEDEVKKNKLINLKNYIIPEFINIFVKKKEDKQALAQAILRHINDEKIPNMNSTVKGDVIKLFFNIIDVILDDRKLSSILTANASSSTIYEAKAAKKKKKSIVDSISKKLDYLLRLGLGNKTLINRIRRALTMDKISAANIKIYRDVIFDLVSEIIEYIEKDSTIYNKMLMILGKKNKALLGESGELALILERCSCKNKMKESAPPNFPEKLEKKLLKYYKDNEQLAYATMWKIHNLRKSKKKQ